MDEDEQSGLLVEPGSVPELSTALERLLTDPSLAARLGQAGRRAIADRFNWPLVVARVEAAYAAVRAGFPPPRAGEGRVGAIPTP